MCWNCSCWSSRRFFGGGEVDEGPAYLGDLLEHLLVGEVEHLVGLLGRVERFVRLGLHDVVCPLEDAHVPSLGVGPYPHHRFQSRAGLHRDVQDPEAATIGPLRWAADMSPSSGASP